MLTMTYDLNAARDHVSWYYQMIDVLAEKLPNITRVINYEDMIADPVSAVRAAANLCGLPATDTVPFDIGDDRDCAAPYREFMTADLSR